MIPQWMVMMEECAAVATVAAASCGVIVVVDNVVGAMNVWCTDGDCVGLTPV